MTTEFQFAARALGLELSPVQVEKFDAFEEALYAANAVMNLTRIPREECWLKHFIDSLMLSPRIPASATVLDIGTGPGFPSWPLACARPDLAVTALDSSGKMLGFLRRIPLENLRVVEARAEDWGIRDAFDVVTGRAVAPLAIQLEISAAPTKPGGCVIPMRTATEREILLGLPLEELGLDVERIDEDVLPGSDIPRLFPVLRKVAPTPARFPRTWAEIKRRPLGAP